MVYEVDAEDFHGAVMVAEVVAACGNPETRAILVIRTVANTDQYARVISLSSPLTQQKSLVPYIYHPNLKKRNFRLSCLLHDTTGVTFIRLNVACNVRQATIITITTADSR